MILSDILENIRSFDEESFICIKGGPYPSPSVEAVVIPIGADPQLPAPPGTEYFIEVYHARDVLTAWSQHRGGKIPTPVEMIDAIYYFRKHNAYLLPIALEERRPRSRKVVIAWSGVVSGLVGCFTFFAASTGLRSGIYGPLDNAGLGFLFGVIEIIDEIGLIPMTLGFFICGTLAAAALTNRFKGRKRSCGEPNQGA